MARPLRVQFPHAVYHVTARGILRQDIFFDEKDRLRFLEGFSRIHERHGVFLHAYVLMTNHLHLLLETPQANLSRAMHDLNAGYASYVRTKYARAGHVLQGRFKAAVVQKEGYLLEVSRYVHLNPVRAGIAKRPEDYRWSSYRVLIGAESAPPWLAPETTWREIGGKKSERPWREYQRYVESKIDTKLANPMERVYGQLVLGGKRFVEWVKRRLKLKKKEREVAGSGRFVVAADLESVSEAVSRHFGTSPEEASQGGGRKAEARSAAILVARQVTGTTLGEIGKRFGGLGYWAAGKAWKRAEERERKDRKWRRMIADLRKSARKLSNVQT